MPRRSSLPTNASRPRIVETQGATSKNSPSPATESEQKKNQRLALTAFVRALFARADTEKAFKAWRDYDGEDEEKAEALSADFTVNEQTYFSLRRFAYDALNRADPKSTDDLQEHVARLEKAVGES